MEPNDTTHGFDLQDRLPSPLVVEDEAPHLGGEFSWAKDECRNAVLSGQGLHHVAHYSSGVYDFAADVLDDLKLGPRAQDTRSREELQRLGRQLSFIATGLDRTLQEARTGALIRTVLHTEEGAIYCNSVVPREYVVGVTLDRSAATQPDAPLTMAAGIRAADEAASDLATSLRRRISQGSQNPGGWLARTEEPTEQALHEEASTPRLDPARPIDDARTDQVTNACQEAVDPGDLHFVAYCRHGDVALVADHLGHPSLGRFFTQITVDARRKLYTNFSHEFGALARRLNRTIAALGGLLVRVVLDVEQGALYYYRLNAGEYVVGVTLDQSQVSQADDRMARLALACRSG